MNRAYEQFVKRENTSESRKLQRLGDLRAENPRDINNVYSMETVRPRLDISS